MIKRKDGSYSQRGLWDNIRANKGSGKKPTAEMLKQEKKIKAKSKKMNYGGMTKMKSGGSKFPDLTGDGKVTQADILKGRGVFKKGGTAKANAGMMVTAPTMRNASTMDRYKNPKPATGMMKYGGMKKEQGGKKK